MHERKRGVDKEFFSVAVTHMKVDNIVWNCGKDHIIREKEEKKSIRLRIFNNKFFKKRRVGMGEREYTGIRI